MMFNRDFVTRENHWKMTPLVTKKLLFAVTHASFYIFRALLDVMFARARVHCGNKPRQASLNRDYNMTFLILPHEYSPKRRIWCSTREPLQFDVLLPLLRQVVPNEPSNLTEILPVIGIGGMVSRARLP